MYTLNLPSIRKVMLCRKEAVECLLYQQPPEKGLQPYLTTYASLIGICCNSGCTLLLIHSQDSHETESVGKVTIDSKVSIILFSCNQNNFPRAKEIRKVYILALAPLFHFHLKEKILNSHVCSGLGNHWAYPRVCETKLFLSIAHQKIFSLL